MKYAIMLTLFLSSVSNCLSQAKTVEEIYEKCYFDAMPNDGIQFKKIARQYEIALIKHGLLKDDTSNSYYRLFKNIFEPGFMDDKTGFHFIDSINTISYVNLIRSNKDCSDTIKSLPHYEKSRSYQLGKRLDSIYKNAEDDINKKTASIVEFYKKEDFELDFYKLRVLLMLPEDISLFEEEKSYSREQLAGAFKIALIEGNKMLINSAEASLKEMKILIKNYFKTKKSTSLIQLTSERNVKYSYYTTVVNGVVESLEELRNEMSLSIFNLSFDKLTPSQKESIEKEYAFEFIDQVVD